MKSHPQVLSPKAIMAASETLGLCGLSDKESLRRQYLALSKRYHPDSADEANAQKFQEVHEAYELLMRYIEAFRFRFDKEEIRGQLPLMEEGADWLSGHS